MGNPDAGTVHHLGVAQSARPSAEAHSLSRKSKRRHRTHAPRQTPSRNFLAFSKNPGPAFTSHSQMTRTSHPWPRRLA